MSVDWDRFGPAIVWTLVVSVIVALARGQGSRLVHYFFRIEDGRALDGVMDPLETQRGRDRLKTLLDGIYAERMRRNDETLSSAVSVANANKDSLAQVAESQKMQGHSLREVEQRVQEVPRLITALESLAETTQNISKEMQSINLSLARIDEREKEREREERRWHNVQPNPGKREGDRER